MTNKKSQDPIPYGKQKVSDDESTEEDNDNTSTYFQFEDDRGGNTVDYESDDPEGK